MTSYGPISFIKSSDALNKLYPSPCDGYALQKREEIEMKKTFFFALLVVAMSYGIAGTVIYPFPEGFPRLSDSDKILYREIACQKGEVPDWPSGRLIIARYVESADGKTVWVHYRSPEGMFLLFKGTPTSKEYWVDTAMNRKHFEYFPNEKAWRAKYPNICAIIAARWADLNKENEQRRIDMLRKEAEKQRKPSVWQRG